MSQLQAYHRLKEAILQLPEALKNNPNFMEAIGGFLLKWLDKPKVEHDQHLLTSYLYAESTKKRVGMVQKGMFFYRACNDQAADLKPLWDHHICYHAFACTHNVARKQWQSIQSTTLTSSLAKLYGNKGNTNAAMSPELCEKLIIYFEELKSLAQSKPTANRSVRGAVSGFAQLR